MTNYHNTNGTCPHCKHAYDAKKSIVAFPGKITGKKIYFVFALCPECYEEFSLGDESRMASIVKTSFTNFVSNQNINWTITTNLCLDFHHDDFFNAWLYGINIPRNIFDAINDGLIEEVFFLPTWTNQNGVQHV